MRELVVEVRVKWIFWIRLRRVMILTRVNSSRMVGVTVGIECSKQLQRS